MNTHTIAHKHMRHIAQVGSRIARQKHTQATPEFSLHTHAYTHAYTIAYTHAYTIAYTHANTLT